MKITKQDVARCIDANQLLHGMTSHGLAVRRPYDRPYPESLDDEMLRTIGDAVDWLQLPLDEGGCISLRDSLCPHGTSYGLKHDYERDADNYIPNGAFIIALALAGCRLERSHYDSLNARSSAWPSHEAVTHMAFSVERRGAREQLADPETIRQRVLRSFARAATDTEDAATPGFWEWVCKRRATDTPRGDFIRDARTVRDERNGAGSWHEQCLLRLAVTGHSSCFLDDSIGPIHVFRQLARQFVTELERP